jgi:hypothetical protein
MDRDRARRIAYSEWPSDALSVSAAPDSVFSRWLGKGRTKGELLIGAHDILDNDADWNASTWLFDRAQLHRFSATLERLFESMPEEFERVAAWIGEGPAREQAVTRAELIRLVTRNELGNAVRYRVAAS